MSGSSGITRLRHGHGPDGRAGYLDVTTGAEITPLSSEWLGYLRDGRMLRIAVEYGAGTLIVWGVQRQWDDGVPTGPADVSDVRGTLTRLAAFKDETLDWVRDAPGAPVAGSGGPS